MPLDAVHPRSPTFADVEEAAARLQGLAVRTPLIESPALNGATGGRVLIKPETLQGSGTFKFRGAYNRLSRLTEAERKRGVVAYSSGNHAQGWPRRPARGDAGADRHAFRRARGEGRRRRAFGGEVRSYDRWTESREAIGAEIAASAARCWCRLRRFHVIAGQGTVGLELAEQAEALGVPLDQSMRRQRRRPDRRRRPSLGPSPADGARPWSSRRPSTTSPLARWPASARSTPSSVSICDAAGPLPGELTFPITGRG